MKINILTIQKKNKLGAILWRNFGAGEALRQEVNELDDVVLGVFEMIQEMWPNPGFNETESIYSSKRKERAVGVNRIDAAAVQNWWGGIE